MKKYLTLVLVIIILIIPACVKEEEPAETGTIEQNQPEPESEPVVEETAVESVCLYKGLWLRNEPGASSPVSTLELGEKVVYLGEDKSDDAGKNYSLIRRKNGEEGWANAAFIAINAKTAVILDETTIYTKDSLTAATDSKLQMMQITAVFNEPAENKFVKISFNNMETSVLVLNRYVKESSISFSENDILSALLYQLAVNHENKDIKIELLKNAAEFADSAFIKEIESTLTNLIMPPVTVKDQGEPEIDGGASAIVNMKNVRFREKPGTEGTLIGMLDFEEDVTVLKRTSEKEEIEGVADYWYHVRRKSGEEGWAFGSFLNFRK